MRKKVYELKPYRGNKTCAVCGRKPTHILVLYEPWDSNLLGAYWRFIVEQAQEGRVLVKEGKELYTAYPDMLCEVCALGLSYEEIEAQKNQGGES